MAEIFEFIRTSFEKFNMPNVSWTDIVEIIVISYLVYEILLWFKKTRAWSLLKGIFVIAAFLLLAELLGMNTILWIAGKLFTILATVIVVVFQPELRKALEQLGKKNFLSAVLPFESNKEVNGRFSDKTISEIIRACNDMARVKTGALIVVEQNNPLTDIERTGISIDGMVSSQLLINIFEHNTPLHDGAVVVRGDRVTAATCYLPLSDNLTLSKDLGTRHRAGVGISEVTDSLTIIVSEETGRISLAYEGELIRNVDNETFRKKLEFIQNKPVPEKKRIHFRKKNVKNEV
ncbi:MAG: diadenylate cyclase CdaA [Lachnospiraceae bacterium]|jgi:diadenylate cyclase|nr:diadenylate cyclase CdaA [Lachnospiraceae bacterium]